MSMLCASLPLFLDWKMLPGCEVGLMAGVSEATLRLETQIERLGPHFRTALVTGERGSKKEAVARALYRASGAAGRFVVCDAARVDGLLQREGVTGAGGEIAQIVEEARGGCLFVRELGHFSLTAQGKLLEILQAVRGGDGGRVRVITSVSEEVGAMVAGGRLRPDLEETLRGIEVKVAPLRERLADLEGMVMRVLDEAVEEFGTARAGISDAAKRDLELRAWPGNDRELESAVRMALLASGGKEIERRHLPTVAAGGTAGQTETGTVPAGLLRLQDVIDAHVVEVLRRCEGNKLKAAEVLGISRSTLYRMLEALPVE